LKLKRSAGLVIYDAITVVVDPEKIFNGRDRFDLDIIDEEFKHLLQKYINLNPIKLLINIMKYFLKRMLIENVDDRANTSELIRILELESF